MSQYYQINIPQLEQRTNQLDKAYPDRMTYHIDNLIEQSQKHIWSIFEQQPDGIILIEVSADGKLYDIVNSKSLESNDRYCMHVDTHTIDPIAQIPIWRSMMLEHAHNQWLVWFDKPIKPLNLTK
jgi:hypothetical protein